MTAITWQNINAPSSRDVGRELAGAQTGILDGVDRLTKVLSDREASNLALVTRDRNAAQEDYLNTLNAVKTQQELAALRMSGVLDQRIAALDPRNQAAVRGAADARMAALQGQTTTANKFTADQRDFEQNTALAAINNPLAINAATQKGALAAIQDPAALTDAAAKVALNDKLRPVIEANTVAQANEDAARLKEVAQGRAIDADVNAFVQNHQQTTAAARDAITSAAVGLGSKVVPMRNDGTIALEQMDSTQKGNFNNILAQKGLPTLDSLETGDTKAKSDLIHQLEAKGYNVSHIARVAAGLDFSLGTGPIAPIGNDLSAFNASIAKAQTSQQLIENQYGVKAEPGGVGPLLKDGLAAIDNVVPKDSARGEIYKERLGAFLRDGGIKVPVMDKDGKPSVDAKGQPVTTRVLPNADQIQMIVAGIDKKWHNTRFGWLGLTDSGMKQEIDDALSSWTQSSSAQKGASELTRIDFQKAMQQVRKAEEPPPPLPTVLQSKK